MVALASRRRTPMLSCHSRTSYSRPPSLLAVFALIVLVVNAPQKAAHARGHIGGELAVAYDNPDTGGEVAPQYKPFGGAIYFALPQTLIQAGLDGVLPTTGGRFAMAAAFRGSVSIGQGLNETPVLARDIGSFLEARWAPWGTGPDSVRLTVYPFDAEPLRLGYLRPASVAIYRDLPQDGWLGEPGVAFRFERSMVEAFIGFKAQAENPWDEFRWAVIGGVAKSFLDGRLRADFGLGYFDDGGIYSLEGPPVRRFAAGGALRVALRRGLPVDEPLDSHLLQRNPARASLLARSPAWPTSELGYVVSAEATVLGMQMADPLLPPMRAEVEALVAAAAQGRLGVAHWLFEATFLYANVPFLVANTPELAAQLGPVPYSDADLGAQKLFLATVERRFGRIRLTPGVSAGVEIPAAITTTVYASGTGTGAEPKLVGTYSIVVRDSGEVTRLPKDEAPAVTLRTRAHLRCDIGFATIVAWFEYRRDPNAPTQYTTGDTLLRAAALKTRNQFGAGAALALRL